MEKCIIGKKIGMTQLFDENGNIVPVTVVEAGPCVVVQRKTTENDGYEAVQIGFGAVSDKRLTKALRGHFAKAVCHPLLFVVCDKQLMVVFTNHLYRM